MIKLARSIVVALMVSMFASMATAAGPFGSINVGNWMGGAYTDDRKGTFSHCSAASEYQNGSSVTITEDVRGHFVLSLADSAWRLMPGKQFAISVTFDDHEHLRLSGVATTSTNINAALVNNVCRPGDSQPTAIAGTARGSGLAFLGGNAEKPKNESAAQICKRSAFFDHFRKSHVMVVQANEQTFQLDLTSADQLLAAISNCVARVKSGGIANAGDFSGATQKASAATAPDELGASATGPLVSGPDPTSPAAAAPEKPTVADNVAAAQASTLESTSSTTAPPENPVGTTFTEPTPSLRPTVAATTAPLPAGGSESPIDLTGAGLVIDHHGYIVTANHVVSNCAGEIHGSLIGDGDMVLQIVSMDVTNDLAVLRAQRRFSDVGLMRETSILVGDPVITIGSSQKPAFDLIADRGFVSSLSGLSNDTRFMQISVPTQSAKAGSPVLDIKGNVVGLIAKKNGTNLSAATISSIPENTNIAIKSGAIRDFLDNSAVSYQIANPQTELATAQIVSNAKAYTVLISCKAR